MPAGVIRSVKPTAVLPRSLSHAFVESQTWPVRVVEYHDGSSQRSAMLAKPRRAWQLAKHIPSALLDELRTFWQAQGVGGFWFYNPKETDPPFSYDATGAATAGRYCVRFASAWSESSTVGPLQDTAIELVEVFHGKLTLPADLSILIDRSGSISASDLTNEKAAACSLVDTFEPLNAGGIAVYAFGDTGGAVFQMIAVSHNDTAIKAAINSIPAGGNTPLYDAIKKAVTETGCKTEILMTDGVNSIGATTLQQAVAACVAGGCKVFTVGFGAQVNPTILRQIADDTGGQFYPAATSGALAAIAELVVTEVAA